MLKYRDIVQTSQSENSALTGIGWLKRIGILLIKTLFRNCFEIFT